MWLDPQTNTIVYDVPDVGKITSVVQEARHIQNGYVAVPNTLHNCQLMRWLGFTVPEPMVDYDWPGRFRPFIAQRTTANFLAVHPRAFVLSDMGTGKTLAALWAADYIMQRSNSFRCLIVAPLSTLQRVWADAVFQNFLNRRSCVVLHGDAGRRRTLLSRSADFYIVNYDGVHTLRDDLAARPDIRMVIIDEASAYRDFRTKRHKLARTLLAKRDYLWLMTGTPTPNGPTDAYGMAKLVNNAFGESFMSYQNRVMTKLGMWKWVPRPGAHNAAHRLMQPSIRFAIGDCVDLPPCTTQARDVDLSVEQAKAYKDMKRQLQITVKEGKPITAVNEGVLRWKLIQISAGAIYGNDSTIHRISCLPRLKVLREVMEQCNDKIIIWASLTSVIQMLYEELKDYTRVVIDGSVSPADRNQAITAFQNADAPRVLIAHPRTASHGLTLVRATCSIWFTPTDSTEAYLQANARTHRPGQTKPTTIVQLIGSPVEREIYRRLDANETLQGLVLALAKGEINGS